MSMKETLRKAADAGRFGDDQLVHMSAAEVAGIAAFAPGGRLPINPTTGLPEAFFFLPFLGALAPAAAAAAAPLAAGATMAAAAPVAAGALGSGIAAGMGAATAALPTAAASSAIPAALSATAPAAMTAAAPAATTAATTAASPLASLLPEAGIDTMTTSAIPAATPTIESMVPFNSLPGTFTTPPAFPTTAAAPTTAALPVSTTPVAATPSPAVGAQAAGGWLDGSRTVASTVAPKTSAANFAPMGGGTGGYAPGGAFPEAPAAPGQGGLGGLLGGFDMNQLMQMAPLMMMMRGGGGGGDDDDDKKDISGVKFEGGDPTFPDDSYEPGIDPEFNYFKPRQYAQGGIIGLQGQTPNQMQPPQQMAPQQPMPQAGIPSLQPQGPQPIPQSPYPKTQVGTDFGKNQGKDGDSDKALIEATVMALEGKHPNPDAVLSAFIKTFGEQALKDLAARVKSMGAGGRPMGDGMSDSVPAMINGQAPANLSEGEFVIPSDVVSGLGNGSTQAGAAQLQDMMGRVRQMRTGGVVQPPAINPRSAMPV